MPAGTFLPPGLTTSDVKITSGGTDNYVMTAVDGETIQGESKLTFDGSTLTLDGDLTFTGAQTISTSSGDLTLTAGGSTGDVLIGDGDGTILYVDGGVGSLGFGTAAVGRRLISIGGSYTSDGSSDSAGVLYSAVNLTAANGDTAAHIGGWFANTFTTQDNSEIIDLVAQVGIYGKAITTGTDTVTNAATLYINEAMSGAGTGNYALWVGAGTSRFDGNIDLNNTGTLLNVGASGNDWTANTLSLENDAGTAHTRILSSNTEADNAQSNAIIEARVSATAGNLTGDPVYLLTVTGGTSWYMGANNNSEDRWSLGTGASVGSNLLIQATGNESGIANIYRWQQRSLTTSLPDSASSSFVSFIMIAQTATFEGTTTVTERSRTMDLMALTLAASGATTINEAAALELELPNEGANVTLGSSTGILIENGQSGTPTNQYGIYIEDLLAGGSDYGIYIAGADTAAIYVASADPIHMGVAGASTGKFEIDGATSGTVTTTVAAAAGTWTLTLPPDNGDAGEQLQTNGSGVSTWEAAGSLAQFKDIHGELAPAKALDAILGTRAVKFNYRRQGINGERVTSTGDYDTEYAGVLGNEFPEVMHHSGRIFSPVSAFGYTVGAVQALNTELEYLRNRVGQLEDQLS